MSDNRARLQSALRTPIAPSRRGSQRRARRQAPRPGTIKATPRIRHKNTNSVVLPTHTQCREHTHTHSHTLSLTHTTHRTHTHTHTGTHTHITSHTRTHTYYTYIHAHPYLHTCKSPYSHHTHLDTYIYTHIYIYIRTHLDSFLYFFSCLAEPEACPCQTPSKEPVQCTEGIHTFCSLSQHLSISQAYISYRD